MFTGIVEALGEVAAIDGGAELTRLEIAAPEIASGLAVGASVSVNGACLTAVSVDGGRFRVEVVPETLRRTNLGRLRPGDAVNLERALRADGRFEGHVVQGHVDATARVASVRPDGEGQVIRIELPADLARYVVEKGSITVDGVSLTVASLADEAFEVALIPHTITATTLGRRAAGDLVNLEADILAKHVERLLQGRSADWR